MSCNTLVYLCVVDDNVTCRRNLCCSKIVREIINFLVKKKWARIEELEGRKARPRDCGCPCQETRFSRPAKRRKTRRPRRCALACSCPMHNAMCAPPESARRIKNGEGRKREREESRSMLKIKRPVANASMSPHC